MKKRILWVLLFAVGVLFGESQDVQVEDFLFTVECDDGSRGSAFLMKDADGVVWMVSNYHVIAGAASSEFISMNDKNDVLTLPDEIEMAVDRDVIRFRVDRKDGFALADDCHFDDTVFAFGNSGGLGVITKSKGAVVGKGNRDIEVSCEIIPGNSGGPVISGSNEVVGVASYIIMPAALELSETLTKNLPAAQRARLERQLKEVKGTRYEGARRFAIPVDNVEWQSLTLEVFRGESELFEGQKVRFGKIRNILSVAFTMTRSISEEAGEPFIEARWVRQYNRNVPESLYSYDGRYYHVRHGSVDRFYRNYGRALFDLHENLTEVVEDQYESAKEELIVRYFRSEMDDQKEDMFEWLETVLVVSEACKK